MMRLKTIAKSTQKWLADGAFLFVETIQQQQRPSPLSIREILLTQARENQNSAATSVLLVDRQIGLMKYHGIVNYVFQYSPLSQIRFSFRGLLDQSSRGGYEKKNKDSSNTTTASMIPNSNNPAFSTKAKVAFMITAMQRSQLSDMGYTKAQIKKLKPMEALIILEHELQPPSESESESESELKKGDDERNHKQNDFDRKLQKLMEEYENDQKLQRNQILAKAGAATEMKNEKQNVVASSSDDAKVEQTPNRNLVLDQSETNKIDFLAPVETTHEPEAKHMQVPNVTSKSMEKEVWFEVVETINYTKRDDRLPITSVIGLYRSEKEAKSCCEIKQNLALKRNGVNKERKEEREYFVRVKEFDES